MTKLILVGLFSFVSAFSQFCSLAKVVPQAEDTGGKDHRALLSFKRNDFMHLGSEDTGGKDHRALLSFKRNDFMHLGSLIISCLEKH